MNAIIFDFDGTIADSIPVVIEIAHKITHRPEFVDPNEVARLRSLGMLEVAKSLKLPRWQWPLFLVRGRRQMARRLHELQPFPGMPEALAALRAEGYQLFIMSSNSQHNVENFLVQHGLGGYFNRVYGGIGMLGKARALKKIVRHEHLQTEKTIYVGDEPRDIDASKAAGMACVAVGWGLNSPEMLSQHAPMVVVRQVSELQRVLQEWGRTI